MVRKKPNTVWMDFITLTYKSNSESRHPSLPLDMAITLPQITANFHPTLGLSSHTVQSLSHCHDIINCYFMFNLIRILPAAICKNIINHMLESFWLMLKNSQLVLYWSALKESTAPACGDKLHWNFHWQWIQIFI